MNAPTVTIFIPTYNYARYLSETIESVLDQDYKDFELIIADDASRDNTEEVCRPYADKDSRIRFFRHEKNKGMVENWNWCMEQAKGQYLKPLLADDRFNFSYSLRKLVDALDQNASVSLVTSSRELMDEESNPIGAWDPLGDKDCYFKGNQIIQRCVVSDSNLIGEPTAVIFRKGDAARGFDPSYRQYVDQEMWFYLLRKGDMAYVGEHLCAFRKHPLQQTAVNTQKGIIDRELAVMCEEYLEDLSSYSRTVLVYKLRKKDDKTCLERADYVRSTLGSLEFYMHYLTYKFTKPFKNFCRSIKRRMK